MLQLSVRGDNIVIHTQSSQITRPTFAALTRSWHHEECWGCATHLRRRSGSTTLFSYWLRFTFCPI